jgi:hypothetical protein
MTVSEYADMASLLCPSCGRPMPEAPAAAPSPAVQAAVAAASGLRLKPRAPEPVPLETSPSPDLEIPSFLQADRVTLWLGPMRWRALLPLAHWVIFIILLIILGVVARLRSVEITRWALYG